MSTLVHCINANLYLPADKANEARSLLETTLSKTKAPALEDATLLDLLSRWFILDPARVTSPEPGLYFNGAHPEAYDELDELVIPTIGHLFARDELGNFPSMEWEVYGNRYRWHLLGKYRVVYEQVQFWRARSII